MHVFLANLPSRSAPRTLVLRILSEQQGYCRIRVSAAPGGPVVRSRTWTVTRADLDLLLKTKMARRISSLRCIMCNGSMTIHEGRISNRKNTGVFLACSGCEACFEI